MKVELKKLKINKRMSEETTNFIAELHVDGEKVGDVLNHGTGGCHDYHVPRYICQKLEEWAKTQKVEFTPPEDPILAKFVASRVHETTLDDVIDKLLQEAETLKFLTSKTKNNVLIRLKGDKPGSWLVYKRAYTPAVQAQIEKEFGDKLECVANRDLKAAVAFC